MRGLLRRIVASAFLRRVALVGGGAALSQAVLFAITPLLSRLYDPVDFGLFGSFVAVLALFGQPFFLRFENALPLCREEELPSAILAAGLAGAGVLAVATGMALVVATVGDPDPDSVAVRIAWLVPVVLVPFVLPRIFLYLAIRRGHYADYALIQTIQSIGQGSGHLLFGVLGAGWTGLVWGHALGGLLATAVGWWRQPLPSAGGRVGRTELRRFVARHYRYPCYLAPSTVIHTFANFAPPVLISTLFDVGLAGFYVLAQRLCTAPLRIVSQAISQVLLGELAHHRGRRARRRIRQLTLALTGALTVPTALILVLDDSFWTSVLGRNWQGFATVLALLFPVFALRFLLESLWSVLLVGERQIWFLIGAAAQAAAVLAAYGGGWAAGLPPLGAVALHMALTVGIMVVQIAAVHRTAIRLGG